MMLQGVTTIQVPQAPPVPAPPVIIHAPAPWEVLPPPVIVLSLFALCAAAAIVLWPLMRAIGRRIEGSGSDALRREVDDLRERVRELEGGQQHVAELEERLDFAERLLAQRRETEHLPRS